ncbi:putative deoxycytidylate deaminase [Lucilia cuprina]|uniref:dCMP deaminase n=1 Tax=Lucilia cuprina TaxID=7375 RepID=A0A0L0BSB9_LUCCU|nr:putative deoxycytidylate deaminase [Lucilia cuprina]
MGSNDSSSNFEIIEYFKRSNALDDDDYFMAIAVLYSKQCKDSKTQKGAIIVDEDDCIVGVGYNYIYKCEDDEQNFMVHAVANAILNKYCDNLKKTRIYTTHFPCDQCVKLLVKSDITKIYYLSFEDKSFVSYRAAELMFSAKNIECNRYTPKEKKINIS